MIGKGRFFDLLTRIADDINNLGLSIGEIMRSFYERYDSFKNKANELFKPNDKLKLASGPEERD